MTYPGILETIGRTPLVELERLSVLWNVHLYAKLEALNPGGSAKDRPALRIVQEGLASGELNRSSVVVESSSGNMGVGLAQACAYYGLRFICVVDPRTSPQNLALLRAYGAKVDYVADPDPATGDFLTARLNRVQELLRTLPGAVWPNQYTTVHNSAAHYSSTFREIAEDLRGKVDYVFCATSTCGTVRGCSEYVRDHGMSTRVVAVDAEGSVIFDRPRGRRLIPGIGAGIRPPLCAPELIHHTIHVTDADCIAGCRRLVRDEAILAGGSSGGVITAVEKMRPHLPAGASCVVILADRGERYLTTVYDDDWVRDNLGEAALRWDGAETPVEPRLPALATA